MSFCNYLIPDFDKLCFFFFLCLSIYLQVHQRKLCENESRCFFQQLIDAVDYCHSKGVYHRDLKVWYTCILCLLYFLVKFWSSALDRDFLCLARKSSSWLPRKPESVRFWTKCIASESKCACLICDLKQLLAVMWFHGSNFVFRGSSFSIQLVVPLIMLLLRYLLSTLTLVKIGFWSRMFTCLFWSCGDTKRLHMQLGF